MEDPAGKVRREEVHRGGRCILQVERRGRDTKGLHHIKMQHKKPKSEVDLGASICT